MNKTDEAELEFWTMIIKESKKNQKKLGKTVVHEFIKSKVGEVFCK
jgi:hypothetical protein